MKNTLASPRRAASPARPRKRATPRNKVVSIDRIAQLTSPKPRIVAEDVTTRRFIVGIGRQRIAFAFTTRITELKPGTGDAPAPVLPVKNGPKGNKNREPG